MRNIFDQYMQPENRVTHALMSALHHDPDLLRAFLRDIAQCAPAGASGSVAISEQIYPGLPSAGDDEAEKERWGIPDAWMTAGDWCLLIENKVLSAVGADQLIRHRRMARRLGYEHPNILVLTVRDAPQLPDGVRVVAWRRVYRWLLDHARKSLWASSVAEFLEVMEARFVEQGQMDSGTLTAFNGFQFGDDNPFSYLEGKRVLGLAITELRNRADLQTEIGMAPDLPGRPAITGRSEDSVWDFLRIEPSRGATNFTEFPHLSLSVTRGSVDAMVTVPHGVRRESLRRVVQLGYDGFHQLVRDVLSRMEPVLMRCDGVEPRMRSVQRRYPSQRAVPFNDAIIDFDLRTAFTGTGPPKRQPQWLEAVYGCLASKNSNFQIGIGARFPYRSCEAVRSEAILDHIAGTWIASRPLINLLTTG